MTVDFIREITDADCSKVTKSIRGRPRPTFMMGQGSHSKNLVYLAGDTYVKGFQTIEIYPVTNGFPDANGSLIKDTDDQYEMRLSDCQYRLELVPNLDLIDIGDHVKLNLEGEPVAILPIETIDSGPPFVLELGTPTPDFKTYHQSQSSSGDGYTDYYIWPCNSDISVTASAFYFSDDTHTCTAASMTFAVPDGVLAVDLYSRILLDISLSYTGLQKTYSRWGVVVYVDGKTNCYTVFENYMVGDSLAGIDITDLVTVNANNVVTVELRLHGDYAEAHPTGCAGHAVVGCSGTMRFYRRSVIT